MNEHTNLFWIQGDGEMVIATAHLPHCCRREACGLNRGFTCLECGTRWIVSAHIYPLMCGSCKESIKGPGGNYGEPDEPFCEDCFDYAIGQLP